MKKLWVRLGVNLMLTDKEAEILFESYADDRENVIRKIISDNRFEVDGECYAPQDSVQDFNDVYGTEYEEYDYDFFW